MEQKKSKTWIYVAIAAAIGILLLYVYVMVIAVAWNIYLIADYDYSEQYDSYDYSEQYDNYDDDTYLEYLEDIDLDKGETEELFNGAVEIEYESGKIDSTNATFKYKLTNNGDEILSHDLGYDPVVVYSDSIFKFEFANEDKVVEIDKGETEEIILTFDLDSEEEVEYLEIDLNYGIYSQDANLYV